MFSFCPPMISKTGTYGTRARDDAAVHSSAFLWFFFTHHAIIKLKVKEGIWVMVLQVEP